MALRQLKLDFTPRPIINGKKNERLTIPCSDEFLQFLDLLSKKYGKSRAELAHFFVLEGMQKALGNAFMAEPHLEKTLNEIMSK
jgi:hypothetical protein